MSAREREKWDARYRERGPATRAPAGFLLDVGDLLPRRGRALDVGGGSGRNALWLARRGLEVTIVDISAQGLALARDHARDAGVGLEIMCADLETEPLPPGPWDVILDFHFLLRPLLARFAAALAPGGLLVFAHPTARNLLHHGKPGPAYLLENGELPGLARDLEPILYREGWNPEGRHEAELVARRPVRHSS